MRRQSVLLLFLGVSLCGSILCACGSSSTLSDDVRSFDDLEAVDNEENSDRATRAITLASEAIAKKSFHGPAWVPYLIRGEAHNELDEYEKGLVDLNAALKFGEDGEIYNARATAYSGLKQYDKALADCNKALQLSNRATFYANRAAVFNDLHEYGKALDDWKAAVAMESDNQWYQYQLGHQYAYLHKDVEALAAFRAAEPLDEDNKADSLEHIADQLAAMGRREEARKAFLEFARISDTGSAYAKAADYIALYLGPPAARRTYEQAMQHFEAEIKEDPADPDPRIELLRCYVLLGMKDKVEPAFQQVMQATLRSGWDDDAVFRQLGASCAFTGKDSEARKWWRELFKVLERPNLSGAIVPSRSADDYYNMGDAAFDLADYTRAEELLTKAYKMKPDDVTALYVAQCKMRRGDLSKANVEKMKQLTRPNYQSLDFSILAEALEKSGNHESAVQAANDALREDCRDGAAFFWRAQALKSLGKAKEAEQDFNRAQLIGYRPPLRPVHENTL